MEKKEVASKVCSTYAEYDTLAAPKKRGIKIMIVSYLRLGILSYHTTLESHSNHVSSSV